MNIEMHIALAAIEGRLAEITASGLSRAAMRKLAFTLRGEIVAALDRHTGPPRADSDVAAAMPATSYSRPATAPTGEVLQ